MQEAINRVVEKIEGWGDALVAMLPNLAVAVLVVTLFWLLARLGRKAVRKASRNVGKRESVVRLLGLTAWATILVVGLFIALGVMQLDKTVTSLLAGAGILGLALGFAVQNTASSLMAGVILSLRGNMRVGDIVETNGHFGTVQQIDLRTSTLLTPQGQLVVLPNKEILENPLTNYSATRERRIDVEVGVSYSDDLERVRRVATEALERVTGRDTGREVEVFFHEFGGSSINLTGRFWIEFSRNVEFHAARSEAIVRLKKAFDAEGINIPFPIRTLDVGPENAERFARIVAGPGRRPEPVSDPQADEPQAAAS